MQGAAAASDTVLGIAYDALAIKMQTIPLDQATVQHANHHDPADTPGTGSSDDPASAHATLPQGPLITALAAPPAAARSPLPKAAPAMKAAPQLSPQEQR